MKRTKLFRYALTVLTALVALMCATVPAQAQTKKPNIITIISDAL